MLMTCTLNEAGFTMTISPVSDRSELYGNGIGAYTHADRLFGFVPR
jgi:hypothetical protein